jgi:sugar O-acyltransferase (sialic acid O-acetyltransferase NeuD family)
MENKNLVIIGAGGMGREVLFLLSETDNHYDILGFIDNAPELQGKIINKFPVLGDDSWLFNYPDKINVVIAIGNPKVRMQTVNKFSAYKNISFPNVIADNVKYSDSVSIGKGNIICFSSIFTVNISIGSFVIINPNTIIGHDVSVGDFVSLYGSVHIAGNVSIGECAEIGVGAKVIQGKSIGDNAVIGAGAAVVCDIPANCTAVGIPAKPIKITIPPPPKIK